MNKEEIRELKESANLLDYIIECYFVPEHNKYFFKVIENVRPSQIPRPGEVVLRTFNKKKVERFLEKREQEREGKG